MTETEHRCAWAGSEVLNLQYHDEEWGMPVHNESYLFEMITL